MLSPGVRLVERPGALHFVDGRRVVSLRTDDATRAAIRAALAERGAAPEAGAPVDDELRDDVYVLLAELGLLQPGGTSIADATTAFAGASAGRHLDADRVLDRLRGIAVHVLGDADGVVGRALADSGLRCLELISPLAERALDPRHDLVVAVADPARPASSLRTVNAVCVRAGVTWLPVSAYDGAVLRVGPLVVPGDTACYECTERRLAANAEYSDLYRDVVADAPAVPAPPTVLAWAASVAALSLLAWIGGADARVPGRLLTLSPADLALRSATVFRVPRCPVCASPDHLHAAAPWAVARDH